MQNESKSGNAPEAEIHIDPYNSSWPILFHEERDRLQSILAPWLVGSIEHVGSTAVPGLAAKPVIDIIAGVESLEASRPAILALASLDYCYFEYRADRIHWFCKPSPQFRTHHLHLMPFEGPLWREVLAFRDYLRTHADVAQEYAELKYQLAVQYRFDREAYTDAKTSFVERIVALARSE